MNHNEKTLVGEGFCWSTYNSLTYNFIIPLILVYTTSNPIIGLASALPFIASMLAQLPGAKLLDYFPSRKLIVIFSGLISYMTWIPIIIIPFSHINEKLIFIMFFIFLGSVFSKFNLPAWVSLLADIIPKKLRGKFFSERQMSMEVASLITFLIGGFFLDLFPKDGTGFSYLFSVALIFGFISLFIINNMKEPRYKPKIHNMQDFLKMDKRFKKFLIFSFSISFALMFASPFFSVFMLENLDMSYSLYALFYALLIFSASISKPHWGYIADKYGDKNIATISVTGLMLVPILFLTITKSTILWIIPIFILAGISLSAFNLAMINLLMDMTTKKDRAIRTAEYSFVNSLAFIIGPILGGFVANTKGIISGIALVFIISTVLRFGSLYFLSHIKEPRIKLDYETKMFIQDALSIRRKDIHKPQIQEIIKHN